METRKQRMVRFVSDSRAEMQLQPLDPKVLDRTVEQWVERLRWLPDDNLDECYQLAMDNHAVRTPLMPKELIDAWTIIRQRPGFSMRSEQRDRLCSWGCSAEGWITVDAGGTPILTMWSEDLYQIRHEYLYVKACPEHRPGAIPILSHAAPHCAGNWPRLRTRPGNQKPQQEGRAVVGWSSFGEVTQKMNWSKPVEDTPPAPEEPPPDGAEPDDSDQDYLGW